MKYVRLRGDVCLWWGRSKKKGRGYVGGGKKKKGRGERGRIYNRNKGRGRKKMRKEGILGVVKKINK
jgi:hypothetical protein